MQSTKECQVAECRYSLLKELQQEYEYGVSQDLEFSYWLVDVLVAGSCRVGSIDRTRINLFILTTQNGLLL
jgi:hypothetical protein